MPPGAANNVCHPVDGHHVTTQHSDVSPASICIEQQCQFDRPDIHPVVNGEHSSHGVVSDDLPVLSLYRPGSVQSVRGDGPGMSGTSSAGVGTGPGSEKATNVKCKAGMMHCSLSCGRQLGCLVSTSSAVVCSNQVFNTNLTFPVTLPLQYDQFKP